MSKYKSELLILPSIQYLALNGIMIDNMSEEQRLCYLKRVHILVNLHNIKF